MFFDQFFELVDVHAVGVNRGADQLRAVQAKALDGGQKGGRLHDHLVARRDHGLADQVQRLLAAGGDDQAFRCDRGASATACPALVGHKGADALAQRLVALGGAVLQHRAGAGAEHGVAALLDTLHIKQRRVRKAAGKADDAGLAQQLEEFADGGGFDVVQALSELHGGLSFSFPPGTNGEQLWLPPYYCSEVTHKNESLIQSRQARTA